jgi:Putative zinc-finger
LRLVRPGNETIWWNLSLTFGSEVMDHEEAQRLMATERYLLGELTPEVRDSFEEHLFGCRECALDVKAAMVFVDQAKMELGREAAAKKIPEAAKPSSKWWNALLRPAIAIPAFAVLLAFIVYQNFTLLPGLHQQAAWAQAPRVLASVSLMAANTRGGSMPTIMVQRGRPFLLFLDIPPDSQSPSYVAELYNSAGTREWSVPISSAAAKDTVSLRAPGMDGSTGTYTLVVSGINSSGGKGTVVARYPFELQFQSR